MSSAFSIATKQMNELIIMANTNQKTLVQIVNEVIGDGSPKAVFDTLQELKDEYPKGALGIYLVSENGNWYYWDEEWLSGGVYQATQLSDGSVTEEKLVPSLVEKIGSIDDVRHEAEEAQNDITNHKSSNQAHNAASITYSGNVIGAATAKQAIDNVQTQLNAAIVSGDSSVAAAQAAVDANGHDYKNLKLRLDTENNQVMTQLAETEQQIALVEEIKADKTEVNQLATEKANQVDLIATNVIAKDAQNKANNPIGQMSDNSIPSSKLDQSTDARKIKLANLSQEVRDAMAGTTTIGNTPAPGSVTPTEMANEAAISTKRTALGEWGIIECDVNAFINFDFENGRVIFDKSVSSNKVIWIVNRKSFIAVGTTGVNDVISFASTGETHNLLTINIKTKLIKAYTISAAATISEDEIILATWIGNNPNSVFCNANNLQINGGEYVSTTKRTTLGDNGLIVVNSSKMINFDWVNRVVEIPAGVKKVIWRNRHFDLPSESLTVAIDTNTTYKFAGIYFDTASGMISIQRTSASFAGNVKETMIQIGGLYNNHDGTGKGFIFGHSVTDNGVFNIPVPPDPSPITENNIYGIRYNINDPNPVVERVENSIGLTAEASIDNSPVTNHFDDVFPWSAMKVCNLRETSWGAKEVTYKGEEGFTYDGSNGAVMVEIPKHYVKRFREGNLEYILVSGTPKDGFIVDPAFIENGKELDKIYVGRYIAEVNKSTQVVYSRNTGYPIATTYDQFKSYLNDKKGYGITDWRVMMMLQRLFLIEFATRNSQSIMGGFSRLVYYQKCFSAIEEPAVNRIVTTNDEESKKFRIGQEVVVITSQSVTPKRTITAINEYSPTQFEIIFTGDPIDITLSHFISNIPQKNGQTDYITSSSGRVGELMNTAFTWRGIENLWGNLWELIDGIKINDLVVSFTDSMWTNDYDKSLSFKVPLQNVIPGPSSTVVYAKRMGIDNINSHIMLPVETGTDTAGFDYWCDGFYSQETGEYIPCVGGAWDHFERGGLFAWRFWNDTTTLNGLNGGRLIYKPI